MKSSPAKVENENQGAFKNFANGASFKMGQQVKVKVGIPDETGDSVELIHLKEGNDNYSLTVNVDGREVGKTSCCSRLLRNLTDVSIISDLGYTRDLRALIVLDKA